MTSDVERQYASVWEEFPDFRGEQSKGETGGAGAVMSDKERSFGYRSDQVYMINDLLTRP